MKDFGWLQNKVVSFVSFVVAIVAICGWIVTVKLYATKLDTVATDVKELKDNQIEQIKLNTKLITIIEMTK
jgi:hypothetical protein